jgi:pyruvate formate lyase activating enzyme
VGLQRLSLIDYPGKLCATIFTAGCNFRCPYCYNEDIVLDYPAMPKIPEDKIIEFLHPRLGFLDGVCVTGGEPTIHRELPKFLGRLKSIGSLVKLDTNGSRPKALAYVMEKGLVNYIALDVKVPLGRYEETVRYRVKPEGLKETIKLIRRSGVDHEFRTTVVPGLLDGDDLEEIAMTLAGSKRYVLQQFRPGKTLCPDFKDVKPYSEAEMRQFRDRVAPYFAETRLRL